MQEAEDSVHPVEERGRRQRSRRGESRCKKEGEESRPAKERGQEADEGVLRDCEHGDRSRCERELPALGWRVCGIGVMGQLVSYCGSSVRRRKGTPCARRRRREPRVAGFTALPRCRRSCSLSPFRPVSLYSREDIVGAGYGESALDIPDT